MACLCTYSFDDGGCSQSDGFTDYTVVKNLGNVSGKGMTSNGTPSYIIWGGVPIDYRSSMNYSYPSEDQGFVPITNSLTAIRRLKAEDSTPPWSSVPYDSDVASDVKESFDSRKGGEFINLYMNKKSKEAVAFQPGLIKNITALRHMKVND